MKRLEITDEGRTIHVFDRRGTILSDGSCEINGPAGARVIDPESDIHEVVGKFFSGKNGLCQNSFVWVDPHALRMLFFSGAITTDHVESSQEGQIRDLIEVEPCYILPGVSFEIDGKPVTLPVVVSPRSVNKRVAVVEGHPSQNMNLSELKSCDLEVSV